MSDAQDRGRQQNDENGWEDEENQWKQYLDLSLRSFFLGALPSLQTNLVSKPAQRSNDGSAKSVSLREHGYKQRELWNQRSFRGASPCLKSMLTCQLFQVNLQEFLVDFRVADCQFLSYS